MDLIRAFVTFLLSLLGSQPISTAPPAPIPTIIQESGLPNYHLIQAPFVAQAPEKNWDQPWQDACEEAAILVVDYLYRQLTPSIQQQRESILQMLDFESQQNWNHDVNLNQMELIASQHLGYQTKIIDDPQIEQIQQYLLQDIPIIVPANGKTLYKENKHFKNGGPWYHNLVILGYDDNKRQFIVHDVGTQFGPYFRYSYNLLLDSIHDFPTSSKKEDINTGAKRVLILIK